MTHERIEHLRRALRWSGVWLIVLAMALFTLVAAALLGCSPTAPAPCAHDEAIVRAHYGAPTTVQTNWPGPDQVTWTWASTDLASDAVFDWSSGTCVVTGSSWLSLP